MDLALIESGDGGDLVKIPKGLYLIQGFENMPYVGMFGGCVEQSTPIVRDPFQQAFDWWGNNLLHPNDPSIQFNSETERALNNYPLTSAGLVAIEDAMKTDLKFMESFATIDIELSVTRQDRLEAFITITKLTNLTSTQLVFIWDATNAELDIVLNSPGNPIPFNARIFDYTFDFNFN